MAEHEINYEKHLSKSDQGTPEVHFIPKTEQHEHSANRYCKCYPKAKTYTADQEMVFYHNIVNVVH